MSTKEELKMIKKKKSILKTYHTQLRKMLSNTDIINTLYGFDNNVGDKIIEYPDLANYSDINELLPNDVDYRIVLIESKPHSGHWTLLWKNVNDKNSIGWFDSYGGKFGKPDVELNYISPEMRDRLGENRPILTDLLKTKNPEQRVIYNKIKFQAEGDEITTCGRWVIIRAIYLLLGYTNAEFERMIIKLKKDTGKPYDIIAVDLSGKY